jgi:hypothetical protein
VTLARTPDSLLEKPAGSVAWAISLVIEAINSLFSLTPVGIAAAMLEMKLSLSADAVGTMAETSEASIALRAELVGKGNYRSQHMWKREEAQGGGPWFQGCC